MFENMRRKGLMNRLIGAGMDPASATTITAAVYPGEGWDAGERSIVSEPLIIDTIEQFIAHRISADTLFQTVFGMSQSSVLGFPDMPPEAPEASPTSEREELVYEGEMAEYGGKCQLCDAVDRPVYPGWKIMGLGVWACEPCLRNSPGNSGPVLEVVESYRRGDIDIVLAQDKEWVRLTKLHGQG